MMIFRISAYSALNNLYETRTRIIQEKVECPIIRRTDHIYVGDNK